MQGTWRLATLDHERQSSRSGSLKGPPDLETADVPTFAESGLEDFKYGAWYGFAFPGGTPKPIIDKMNEALKRVLARDDVRRNLEVAGTIATLSTPGDLREIIEWDIKKLKGVAEKSRLEPK